MELGLSNRLAVITGAAQGIGKAIAEAFSAEGACLLLVDRNEDLAVIARELRADAVVGDLQDPDLAKVIANRTAAAGGAAVLINNAGISLPAPLKDISDRDWNEVMDVNVGAAFRLIRSLWSQLSDQSGAVVNIASFAAKRSTLFGNNSSYVASKHAIAGLTRAAAFEGAPRGVRVNAIAPGVVATDMVMLHDEETRDRIKSYIPQGRFAATSEIADLALFLASDRSRHICGEVIGINGGLLMD